MSSPFEYGVQVRIEEEILRTLAADGYSLCIQKYTSTDGSTAGGTANVIAAAVDAHQYSSLTTFQWNDSYSIGATNIPFQEGGFLFGTQTDQLPIATDNQDSFVLTSWDDYAIVSPVPVAPANGFAFQPSKNITDPGASAVVYLTSVAFPGAAADKAPFFISPRPDIGGSDNVMVPIEKVVVFFFRDDNIIAKSGTMISSSRAYPQVIDVTTKHQRAFKLTNLKSWEEVPYQ